MRNGGRWRVPISSDQQLVPASGGAIMTDEKLQSELRRLNTLQSRARQDEVFGGFSRAQRIEYNKRERRIHDLETELQAGADSEQSGMTAGADQRREWNKSPETDNPQSAAPQSYRSREKGFLERLHRFVKDLAPNRTARGV